MLRLAQKIVEVHIFRLCCNVFRYLVRVAFDLHRADDLDVRAPKARAKKCAKIEGKEKERGEKERKKGKKGEKEKKEEKGGKSDFPGPSGLWIAARPGPARGQPGPLRALHR